MARNWAYSYRKMEHQLDLKMMRRGGGWSGWSPWNRRWMRKWRKWNEGDGRAEEYGRWKMEGTNEMKRNRRRQNVEVYEQFQTDKQPR
jgi:hypothetical protein